MNYWESKSICTVFTKYNDTEIINKIDPVKSNIDHSLYKQYTIGYMSNFNIVNICKFVNKHSNYIFDIDTFSWLVLNPFSDPSFNIVLYDNDKIVATIVGILRSIKIKNEIHKIIHTTFLTVDENYRKQGIHFYIIDKLMENAFNKGVLLGIFSTMKKIKKIKCVNVQDTYIIKSDSKKYKENNNVFDYKKLNQKNDDLYFIYNDMEIEYWFNKKYCHIISIYNNLFCFLKIKYKNNENLNILIEQYIHNKNINKYSIPNNSIMFSQYIQLPQIKLQNQIYTYIYNLNFNNLKCNICMF
ncbi:ORF MSV072 hypothetical protein [Melanoplus sanguinipes entomopoxvirus]|uniref:Putative glycylpeptide N-tetradecanoyltransferase n=1 Tax=Melanoplus sanguinipes entomopoxvirus TaxID=83191 RepID=NMT_MSEPV|nr:ORF MSV072 hypothetical protein [Melanoplus sanguinipes entomopoxvirus]Q9YW20.1 RecName: Full=Putative glycylpeptide N-tetradecanoyltransferase; AltName: Full=Myristoyl-CoA:protein N-myristoyltransferase; Short=NMT; AltName: Full=Peptide N-myristoyltransferase [Melanoplus sanguinipes entomopoxvirus]AAC97628.1 ORF MSV072 hypothetical protein [Melanoplus sanguinipes entomopoxvirus 'O']